MEIRGLPYGVHTCIRPAGCLDFHRSPSNFRKQRLEFALQRVLSRPLPLPALISGSFVLNHNSKVAQIVLHSAGAVRQTPEQPSVSSDFGAPPRTSLQRFLFLFLRNSALSSGVRRRNRLKPCTRIRTLSMVVSKNPAWYILATIMPAGTARIMPATLPTL